jgi:MscS family membrane protein
MEFLELVFLGNSVRQWFVALGIVLAGFIVGKLCALILGAIAKNIVAQTKNQIDDALIAALKTPLTLLVFIGSILVALSIITLTEEVHTVASHVVTSSVIIVIAWCINRLLEVFVRHYVPARGTGLISQKEVDLQPILRKLFGTLVWIVAIVLVLRNLGYNVSAIMAGLGLGGAALALASRDTLANFFGSITVFVDRPFRINDRIKVSGYDGFITDMGIRTSRIRTLDNRIVIIPNSVFSANPIENISAEPNTKVTQILNIKREKGMDKITQSLALLKTIASQIEGTGGIPQSGVTAITGAACQVTFIYYVIKGADYLATVNKVNNEILKRFEEAGILLA